MSNSHQLFCESMLELKHTSIIIGFSLTCLMALSFTLLTAEDVIEFQFSTEIAPGQQQLNDQSFFTNSHFFQLEQTRPVMSLYAKELMTNQRSGVTLFVGPKGEAYNHHGDKIDYSGDRGQFYEDQQRLVLLGDVSLEFENSSLNADRIVYQLDNDLVESTGRVRSMSFNPETRDRISINSDRMVSRPRQRVSEYKGHVAGEIIRQRAYEQSVRFTSNLLAMDLNEQLIRLSENVRIKKRELSAQSNSGEIHLENYNKNLKYFVLNDDVRLEEKVMLRSGPFVRKAYAQRLEGVVSEELLVLTGYPKVHQQNDVIRGNRIVLRENNEVIEVDDAQSQFRIR